MQFNGNEIGKKEIVLGAIAIAVVGFLFWFMLSPGESGLSSNSPRSDQIGRDISSAQERSNSASDRVGAVEGQLRTDSIEAGRLGNEINSLAEKAGAIGKGIESSQSRTGTIESIADEGERIVSDIQARGTVDSQ